MQLVSTSILVNQPVRVSYVGSQVQRDDVTRFLRELRAVVNAAARRL